MITIAIAIVITITITIIIIHLYSANTMKYSKALYIQKEAHKLKQRFIKRIKRARNTKI